MCVHISIYEATYPKTKGINLFGVGLKPFSLVQSTPSKNTTLTPEENERTRHLFVPSKCDKNGKFHADFGYVTHTKRWPQLISSFKKQVPFARRGFSTPFVRLAKPPINRESYLHPSPLVCWVTMPNGECFK